MDKDVRNILTETLKELKIAQHSIMQKHVHLCRETSFRDETVYLNDKTNTAFMEIEKTKEATSVIRYLHSGIENLERLLAMLPLPEPVNDHG